MNATLVTTQTQALAPILESTEIKIVNKFLESGPIDSNAHVAIAFDVIQSVMKLNNLADTIKPGGFVITCEANNISESAIMKSNLVFISKLSVDDAIFYLLRKVSSWYSS